MRIYLSVNNKFIYYSPRDFIRIIKENDKNKCIKGFEIFYNLNSISEMNFYKELIDISIENGYDIQFHGDSSLNIKDVKKYIDCVQDFSKIYSRKFNIVLHPICTNDIDNDIKESNIYFSEVLNYIYFNNYNINISIENLNTTKNMVRCSKEDVLKVVTNNEDLNFTYDIGHEISNYGSITDLDILLINRLCNVHIHTFNIYEDHMQLLDSDEYKEKWIKGLLFLKSINYKGPIVLEFDFNKLGNDYESRLKEYINIASYLEEYL